jgi:hypothetical protein
MPETTPLAPGSSTHAHGEPAPAGNWRCVHDTADHSAQFCRRDHSARYTAKPRGTPTLADARFVDPWRGC